MKKKLLSVVAAVLALTLLCGCAMPGKAYEKFKKEIVKEEPVEESGPGEICRFDDMPYARPNLETFRKKADELIAALEGGTGFRPVVALLDEVFALYYTADTMCAIADIRNCRDLSDEYYAGEYAACLDILSEMGQMMEQVYLACGTSKHSSRLERDYFGEGFLEEYGLDAEETLTEGYMDLVERENELIAEYRALSADPVIELRGKRVSLSDALYDAWTDREVDRILQAYYEQYNDQYAEIYLDLVRVRNAQAKELKYDSAEAMMNELGYDRDFSVEDSRAFMERVKKWIMPLYTRYMDLERYSELSEDYVSAKELSKALEAVARNLGGEAAEACDFMRRYELCDLDMSDSKADMSFQTYLTDYDAPYLFMNPYGDMSDYLTVTHEFGHYVESYISYGAYRSMDVSEIFSQAMQFLSLRGLRDALGDRKTEKLRQLNLMDILESLVEQTAYAEFERRVYSLENPNAEDLNRLFREINEEYGLGDSYGGKTWIDIPHFFEQPFYVFGYAVSACCAAEIYERELERPGAGFELYLRLVDSVSPGIAEASKEAGLQNPLTDERVKDVAAFLEKQFAA